MPIGQENQNMAGRIVYPNVIDAFHASIARSVYGFCGIAERLGISTKQLYDECNSGMAKRSTGKLGVSEAIEVLKITDDLTPLHTMAAELSCRVRPLPAPEPFNEPEPLFAHLALDAAATAFKQLDAHGASYETLIAAMRKIADAAEVICAMARARDSGKSPIEAFAGRALFQKEGR